MNELLIVNGKKFKCPSKMRWKKSDISAADAGRTEDTLMHKNQIGKKRTLSLGWTNLSKTEMHDVLTAFDQEYVQVTYWDPLDGGNTTREFYTGDMEADVKWWNKGRERYSSLSFDIIER